MAPHTYKILNNLKEKSFKTTELAENYNYFKATYCNYLKKREQSCLSHGYAPLLLLPIRLLLLQNLPVSFHMMWYHYKVQIWSTSNRIVKTFLWISCIKFHCKMPHGVITCSYQNLIKHPSRSVHLIFY